MSDLVFANVLSLKWCLFYENFYIYRKVERIIHWASMCSLRFNKYFSISFFLLGHLKIADIMTSSLQYISLKNEDIFLHQCNTIIIPRKINSNSLILSNIWAIFIFSQLCQECLSWCAHARACVCVESSW